MGREVGGGIGMGKTCEPKAFSFQCMTKFTTNKKILKKNSILSCFREVGSVFSVKKGMRNEIAFCEGKRR